MFTTAKWIWLPSEAPDTYADFIADFSCGKSAELRISCDSNYAAYVNGQLAAFAQFADYPTDKIGDTVDISKYLHDGINRLAVIVWYYGEYSKNMPFTYAPGRAGVIFEIESDGKTVAASGSDTLSRPDTGYVHGACSVITSQIGLSFRRDEVHADDRFITESVTDGFAPSRVVDGPERVSPRPIKMLELGERCPAELMRMGVFTYADGWEGKPSSHNMHYASIAFRHVKDITDKQRYHALGGDDGVHITADGNIFVLIDLKNESVGFLDLDIELSEDCLIDIGWGEHIADGICRTSMRGFGITVDAKAGHMRYMNPFRRFGCRYIQLFIHSKSAVLHYAGIRPTDYPLEVKPFDMGNILRNTIYGVSVDTLRMCMHEHYEDCPWREQALYALDSRNQMLCGYYAFGEYRFARASLKLIGESMNENGLLSICAPMKGTLCIPSFSLAYFISMREYIEHSGDISLAEEMFPTLSRLMETFTSRIDESDLIPSFEGSGVYWNFYEWSPTLSGNLRESYNGYEAALNLMLIHALESYITICEKLDKELELVAAIAQRSLLLIAVNRYFWDSKRKLFRTSDRTDTYSVLVNSLALLTGALLPNQADEILRILETNGKNPDGSTMDGIIPNTLSMNCFRFDALLAFNRERYKDTVLNEIDSTYFSMLQSGATSFWETERGECDFDEAGSLCHGWSALPVYYYSTLL